MVLAFYKQLAAQDEIVLKMRIFVPSRMKMELCVEFILQNMESRIWNKASKICIL